MDFTVICWIPRPLVVARRDTSAPQVGWPTNRWCLSPAARKRIHTIILNICGYTCICIYIYIYGHVFAHNFYVTYISYIIRIVYIYIYCICILYTYGVRSEFVVHRMIISKIRESPIVLHDFVQSDILDDHSQTTYLNTNVEGTS